VTVRRLGLIGYEAGQQLQSQLVEQRKQGLICDTLLLLRHTPTITVGSQGQLEDLLVSREELDRRGVELHVTNRGGQLTYHGPQQLVGYAIFDLAAGDRADLHRYLRDLEQVVLDLLATYELTGERVSGRTGIWVRGQKICALGVRVSRWVTSHGLALNVGPELSGFELIVPCGIRDAGVTSLARELARTPPMEEVEQRLEDAFRARFEER
jgi:lipoyl(octanoyl) transferase